MSSQFVPIKTAEIEWREQAPYSLQYNDIYAPAEGATEQAFHVFIGGNQLIERWECLDSKKSVQFNIGETGFGAGLNFLMTWQLWERHAPSSAQLHFVSSEKHPLSLNDLVACHKMWPELQDFSQQLIDQYPILTPGFHRLVFAQGRVVLTLMLGDSLENYEQLLICGDSELELSLRVSFFDAWYLDGFTPKKNECMWSDSLFQVIAMLSKKGTTIATYTVASKVKSRLRDCGFTIEKRKGLGTKRHRLTGIFNEQIPLRLKKRHTPWYASKSIIQEQKAIILGGGLAGCFMAYSLAKRGWEVTLVEASPKIGQGASGNQKAILFPKLSGYRSPLTQFMLTSYLYALRQYKHFLSFHDIGVFEGLLMSAFNEREQKSQNSLIEWLEHYPELASLVNATHASTLCGITLDKGGLYIPDTGWIDSPALCHILVGLPNISVVTDQDISHIDYANHQWCVGEHRASVAIIANGYQVNHFEQTNHLPVKPIRGQMSVVAVSQESQKLKIPLCGEGHVLPQSNGMHYFGASYGLGKSDSSISLRDDNENLLKLQALVPSLNWSNQVVDHWAGIRASTPDYLPLVGPVPIREQFYELYSGLESNSNRWVSQPAPCYPGLFVCAGFGSRGLTTVPLSTEWLAGFLNAEVGLLPRSLIQSIAPARFLRRNIIRNQIKPL